MILKLWLLLFVFAENKSFAYPEFIGMGYTGCMTCHFNGAGNGGLNDYGRGLFAAEIASKLLWNSKKTDESLSAKSGFLGSTNLPYWFRPSIKYRGLNLQKNPGSKTQKINKFYQMQEDLNIHVPLNEDQTYLVAVNLGLVPEEIAASPNKTFSGSHLLSREYYLRAQVSENTWIYAGFMDKVFGIRHPDHTAVNRGFLGLGQNNQVHGLVLHYAKDSHEIFLNPYAGNIQLKKDQQFPGINIHYEYEPLEKLRFGVSYMRDNDTGAKSINTIGFLVKRGIGSGHSVLAETGIKSLTASSTGEKTNSFYLWTQATMKIIRGVFFQSFMEYLKADTSKISSENNRMGIGILAFPFQRFEFRFLGSSSRVLDPTQVSKDTWVFQSQLHLSF